MIQLLDFQEACHPGFMRKYLFTLLLVVPSLAWALPDDATLTKMLVGDWASDRHEYIYRKDGTWTCPEDEWNGTWRIQNGKLITTFQGDKGNTETIIELTKTTLKTDAQTLTRKK
jgi:Lipocalin-like domain